MRPIEIKWAIAAGCKTAADMAKFMKGEWK